MSNAFKLYELQKELLTVNISIIELITLILLGCRGWREEEVGMVDSILDVTFRVYIA